MPVVASLLDLIVAATGRPPRVYDRRTLVSASHEIEDRHLAMACGSSVMFGGFQRARFFHADRRRWEALAGASAVAVVAYGGAPASSPPAAGHGAREIVVGPDDPCWRDWVCLSYTGGEASAVLAARDLRTDPDRDPPHARRCAGLVSHDPRVAEAAARWAAAYLGAHDAALSDRWRRAAARAAAAPPEPRRLLSRR